MKEGILWPDVATDIGICIDFKQKAQANALIAKHGMDLSIASNIFELQSLQDSGIYFGINVNPHDEETATAMLKEEKIAKNPLIKGCADKDELLAELFSEIEV